MNSHDQSLWRNTLGYGGTGRGLAYLDAEQNRRLERIRVARMLWKGQHRCAYLDEQRTQFHFKPLKVQGKEIVPYVTFNVLKLISTTITDLLVGAEPLMRIDGEGGQTALNELVKRSNLHRVFYDAAKEASWAAEGMVEITRFNGEVYVQDVPPSELFPLGPRNPDGQYTSYRRFATETVTEKNSITGEEKHVKLLLETTYTPGSIERKCFVLDDGNKRTDAPLSKWPVKRNGLDLPEKEGTGIDAPTIVWVPNELDEGCPTSDYDGIIELQDELNHKQTQIAMVLHKHGDPRLAMHSSSAPGTWTYGGNIPASQDLFYFNHPDQIPRYITWDPKLAEAVADRDFTLNALCIAAELSPVLLGIKQGATPDAARKLRLEATKSLARKDRKAAFVRPFVRTTLDRALAMDRSAKVVKVAMGSASLELRDGLPVDEIDEANALSLLTGGRQVMSIERAVERQLTDPEAAAEELARLKKSADEATPSIFGGFNGREPGEERDEETTTTQPRAEAPEKELA